MAKKQSRGQKRQAKTKKRQQRRPQQASSPSVPFFGDMGFDDESHVPQGFRPISMSQAMMEYTAPIMDYVDNGTVENVNDALQIGMALWNVTLIDTPASGELSRAGIVNQIQTVLKMDATSAATFFDQMIERKSYLFPEDIQPSNPMTLFMRKEIDYLITQFEESQLNLSDTPIPAEADDQPFLNALHQLDELIESEAGYDDWEAEYIDLEDLARERYQHWLEAKGVPEPYRKDFPFYIELYLNFMYRYEDGRIREVLPFSINEFFMDHLMRKAIVRPPQYTQWPAAVRLFYRFLAEKGYLENPSRVLDAVTDIEPEFIELVRERS